MCWKLRSTTDCMWCMRRRKRSCILSHNSCSHKKYNVKISTTFCPSPIPCTNRWGTQGECGVDFIGLSRRLPQCFASGRVRPQSLSVGHCTVHLAAIKQAIPLFSFTYVFLFFFHFVHPTRTLFLSSDLPFMIPSFFPSKSFDSLFS